MNSEEPKKKYTKEDLNDDLTNFFLLEPDFIHQARLEFLQTVKKLNPDILLSLYKEVYPNFTQYCQEACQLSGLEIADELPYVKRYLFDKLNTHKLEKLRLLDHSFYKWLEDWALTEVWCRQIIFDTLAPWERQAGPPKLDWSFDVIWEGTFSYEAPIEFIHAAWDGNLQTWPEYEIRAIAKLKRKLNQHKAQKETFMNWNKSHTPYHFEWLVKYQINKLNFSEIRNQTAMTPSPKDGNDRLAHKTITDGIKNLAKLIGLNLRRSKSGRPKQSR